jgi:hypothetical protein
MEWTPERASGDHDGIPADTIVSLARRYGRLEERVHQG